MEMYRTLTSSLENPDKGSTKILSLTLALNSALVALSIFVASTINSKGLSFSPPTRSANTEQLLSDKHHLDILLQYLTQYLFQNSAPHCFPAFPTELFPLWYISSMVLLPHVLSRSQLCSHFWPFSLVPQRLLAEALPRARVLNECTN